MNAVGRTVRIALTVITGAMLFGACAQDVGDIDRTQPEAILKSDLLDATWYLRQTVSDVPPTTSTFFVGYTFDTEKIVWEIQESYLVGYRAYELIPGLTDRAQFAADGTTIPTSVVNEGRDPTLFRDQPVAAYRIISHFDIQRQYNPTTGEQTNVILENTSDRPWYARDYMRVDWGTNWVASFTFMNYAVASSPVQYHVPESEGGEDARRMVYDEDGTLQYMDFVERHAMQPSLLACLYYLNAFSAGDCVGQQVEVRTSLLRVPEESSYEPVFYDDADMSRFGYFRTERLTYDRRRGATMDGRIQLANRHNLWENTWQRDANGNILRDATGRRVARPFAERTPRPLVYHLSAHFPETLLPYAIAMSENWDRSYRRAVAAAQTDGDASGWQSVRPMFVLCQNPVTDQTVYPTGGDAVTYASDCGEVGTEVRIGDLRYHVVYWVHNPQAAGPLGYGPSGVDPETGEIISGTAYVYGGAVDTYAQYSVDLIRFVNGDLTPDDIYDAAHVREQVRANMAGHVDPRAAALANNPHLADLQLRNDVTEFMGGESLEMISLLRQDLAEDGSLDMLPTGQGWERRRIKRIRESGVDLLAINDEQLAIFGIDPTVQISDEELETVRLSNWMARHNPAAVRAREFALGRECILQRDSLDDSILGIARHYAGRNDYDQIYLEIRGAIFQSVMEHEVGHTIGLRHNFSGSWDSINYHPEFWDMKKEGYPGVAPSGEPIVTPFGRPATLADTYGIAALTEAQIDGRMREYQYSSIMDYSSAFNTDFAGVGPYDDAAVMYAYTAGAGRSDAQSDSNHPAFNVVERGFVEVWDDLPQDATNIFRNFEGRRGIGYFQPLEVFHYSTIMESLQGNGTIDDAVQRLWDRSLMRADEVDALREANVESRPMEVPYMFCSDEYRGLRQSCRTWDRGADPLEQTLDYIERYRSYYYFDNYRRSRLGWFGSNAGQVAASRYFFPLVDGYQRWLLTVAISGSRPDSALDNGWTFAAYAGLNLLAEVITTPNSGAYVVDNGQYRLVSYAEVDGADIYIPEGIGRRRFSRYDANLGYHYARFPLSAGHYWTYINALFAITSAETAVAGVEVGQFDTTYIIPPYLVFADELTRLFNAVATGDNAAFAPLVVPSARGYSIEYRPMLTLGLSDGTLLNPENGAIVRPDILMSRDPAATLRGLPIDARLGFSEQIYAMILSMSSFNRNYSTRFVDQSRVFIVSAGEIPELASNFEIVQFCDPTPAGVGKCYAAYHSQGLSEPSLGADMVLRGAEIADRYHKAVQDGNTGQQQTAARDMENLLTDLNIVMLLTDVFGSVPL